MALKRLKEAGTKLICLPPNINFLPDLVHFCYPSPQLGKKLHHFSFSAFTSPRASSSELGTGVAHSGGWRGPGPEWLLQIFMGPRGPLTGCQLQNLGNLGNKNAGGPGQSLRDSVSAPDPNPASATPLQMHIRLKGLSRPHSPVLVQMGLCPRCFAAFPLWTPAGTHSLRWFSFCILHFIN